MSDTPNTEVEECVYDYADLSTSDLAKVINDEYSVIQQAEAEAGRKNLQRALKLAIKLGWLRARAVHGEWKGRFKSYGLNISYETAALYLRIADNWEKVLVLARAKGVDPTLLTIDAARELLTTKRPKSSTNTDTNTNTNTDTDTGTDKTAGTNGSAGSSESKGDDTTGGNDTNVGNGGNGGNVGGDVEAGSGDGDELTVEVMFKKLTTAYADNEDDLKALTRKLCEHVGLGVYEKTPHRPTAPANEFGASGGGVASIAARYRSKTDLTQTR